MSNLQHQKFVVRRRWPFCLACVLVMQCSSGETWKCDDDCRHCRHHRRHPVLGNHRREETRTSPQTRSAGRPPPATTHWVSRHSRPACNTGQLSTCEYTRVKWHHSNLWPGYNRHECNTRILTLWVYIATKSRQQASWRMPPQGMHTCRDRQTGKKYNASSGPQDGWH